MYCRYDRLSVDSTNMAIIDVFSPFGLIEMSTRLKISESRFLQKAYKSMLRDSGSESGTWNRESHLRELPENLSPTTQDVTLESRDMSTLVLGVSSFNYASCCFSSCQSTGQSFSSTSSIVIVPTIFTRVISISGERS